MNIYNYKITAFNSDFTGGIAGTISENQKLHTTYHQVNLDMHSKKSSESLRCK